MKCIDKLNKFYLFRIKVTAEEYLRMKRERRAVEKERRKVKRAAIREAGGDLPKRKRKK